MRVSNRGRIKEKEIVVKVDGKYATLTKVSSGKNESSWHILTHILCYSFLLGFILYYIVGM